MSNPTPKPQGKNLRKGRFSQSGGIYLITTVTQNRLPLFQSPIAARACAQQLHATTSIASNLAWVVMPDHIHWLLAIDDVELSTVVQQFKSKSARRINAATHQTGQVWQPGFHDRALRHNDEIKTVARYLVGNPLRARLCSKIGDYPYWNATWL